MAEPPRRVYQPKSKYWTWTLNTPRAEQLEDLFSEAKEGEIIYAVWQLEEGNETEREHLQGYCILKEHRNLNWIKRLISNRVHAEISRGSAEDNQTYCTKEKTRVDGPWTMGAIPENVQGKRNDLLEVQKKIDGGVPMREIADEHFSAFVKYNRGFSIYKSLHCEMRITKSQVIALVGPTSIGKSYWARENTRGEHGTGFVAWDKNWFCGYNGTDDLIFNDFIGQVDFGKMLQIMDEGQWTLNQKGGSVQCNPKRIVITSNFMAQQWYDYVAIRGNFDALKRRIDFYFDASDEEAFKIYFNDDWTKNQNIPSPYNDGSDLESTLDMKDGAYAIEEEEDLEGQEVIDLANTDGEDSVDSQLSFHEMYKRSMNNAQNKKRRLWQMK